jgi:chromosome partitioning protein
MRKVAIVNRKGGVGKTTTSVNIAHWLARTGNRVLLIETDTQAYGAGDLAYGSGIEIIEMAF